MVFQFLLPQPRHAMVVWGNTHVRSAERRYNHAVRPASPAGMTTLHTSDYRRGVSLASLNIEGRMINMPAPGTGSLSHATGWSHPWHTGYPALRKLLGG